MKPEFGKRREAQALIEAPRMAPRAADGRETIEAGGEGGAMEWVKSHPWVTLFAVLAALGMIMKDDRRGGNGEEAARAFFARQVIRCYQMSDYELHAHESMCRDALRRIGR